jgi:hypothetical protein
LSVRREADVHIQGTRKATSTNDLSLRTQRPGSACLNKNHDRFSYGRRSCDFVADGDIEADIWLIGARQRRGRCRRLWLCLRRLRH